MTKDLALRVAALKVLSDYATNAYNAARAEIGETMERGDRLQVKSPLDPSLKIGPVYKTDPKRTAIVTSERELIEWFEENHADQVVTTFEISGSDADVHSVLYQHAPHLLREKRKISTDALRDLRTRSADIGQPIGPGGEVDVPGLAVHTPDAVVACKPAPDTALAAVIGLVRAGQLDLETVLRPVLEVGE